MKYQQQPTVHNNRGTLNSDQNHDKGGWQRWQGKALAPQNIYPDSKLLPILFRFGKFDSFLAGPCRKQVYLWCIKGY